MCTQCSLKLCMEIIKDLVVTLRERRIRIEEGHNP